jgi:peptidyl-dipeptidase A
MKPALALLATFALLTAPASAHDPAAAEHPATPEGAAAFVDAANAEIAALVEAAARASWLQLTYITYDSEILAAQANEKVIARAVELAKEAARWNDVDGLDPAVRRQLDILKRAISMPAPSDPQLTKELSQIAAAMESNYGSAQWCPEGAEPGDEACRNVIDFGNLHMESRDAAELEEAWVQWRTTSPAIRDEYVRFAELTQQGAQELGFADLGEMWRSNYDMEPDAFAVELDRLWGQVKPLYDALHCHVRARLAEHYGEDVVPLDQPIPAHLLGNIWAQSWGNIYDLVGPEAADPGYDLTTLLEEHEVDALKMVKTGEAFFTSLGFAPLPDTFWERSLFVKPRDREVVCHASAWDLDDVEDLRIKMCIEINAEDFNTIHHELGHNFYQRAYNQLPYIFRNSANDGFHEAIGDAIALSITPAYLVDLGLIAEEPPTEADLGLLMRDALDKVAFLPFGLLIDQWRWKVFNGEVSPDEYNQAWWELREKYQGIRPPVERTESDFDPGAKYHVPGNTPYTRYFLAHILQFQFHRSMCELAGYEGPLNRCTIYGSEEAGGKLNEMLELGMSKPWPEALAVLTGQGEMDATAILDYFAPLKDWLDEQNQGRTCGW